MEFFHEYKSRRKDLDLLPVKSNTYEHKDFKTLVDDRFRGSLLIPKLRGDFSKLVISQVQCVQVS